MARREVVFATIPAGASVSATVAVDRGEIVGFIFPPRWTPAKLTFQVRATTPAWPAETYLPITDQAAAVVEIADPTTAGTNQVQTLTETGSPTGGDFKLSFKGEETAALAFNISAANLKTALAALSTIGGAGNIDTAGGALNSAPITVTFKGALMEQANPLLVLSNNGLTGGTTPSIGVAETTPAVAATIRYVAVTAASKALSGLGQIRLVSGTTASPVAQTEDRVVGIVVSLDD